MVLQRFKNYNYKRGLMKKIISGILIFSLAILSACNAKPVGTDISSDQPKVTPFETRTVESETELINSESSCSTSCTETTRYDEDYLAGLPGDVLIEMFNITPDGLDYRFVGADYPLDCDPDLIYDADAGSIKGSYENIDFDVKILTDEDNLPEVGIYREIENDPDWFDFRGLRGWTGDCDIQAFRLLSGFVYYDYNADKQYIVDNSMVSDFIDSMEFIDVSSNDELQALYDSISSQYGDVYPYVYHFRFDNDLLDSPACTTYYMRGFNTDVDTSDLYCFRREYNGLPVTTAYPTGASSFISWDEEHVGFVGDLNRIKYNYNLNMYAEFAENHLVITETLEDGLTVIPVEDCIENCISQIRYDTSDFDVAKVSVFAAELTYTCAYEFLPATYDEDGFVGGGQFVLYGADEGAQGMGCFLIPTWSIYYTYETPEGFMRVGTAFLNASTGEGLAIDSQVILDSYLYSEVYEASLEKIDMRALQPGYVRE